jgi:hypothetical protein
MNIMPFSKYNIGIVISLILVILLSQSKIFNFFLNTILGKSIFIILLIFISFIHKILGVVVILFFIIFFNNSHIAYVEGFTNNKKATIFSNKDMSFNNETLAKDKVNQNLDVISKPVNIPIQQNKNTLPNKKDKPVAKEGFDIIGTENNIKRGKQSNSIPVNDKMRMSSDVSPHEGFSFSNFSSMV